MERSTPVFQSDGVCDIVTCTGTPSASKDNESTKVACILCCLYGVSQVIEVQAKFEVKGSTINRKDLRLSAEPFCNTKSIDQV